MKIVIESLMIFLGTLMTAGLVALGEPANAELAIVEAVIAQGEAAPVPAPGVAPSDARQR